MIKLSRNYVLFLVIITILLLINLFVANDFALVWDGPEAWRIWRREAGENLSNRLFLFRLPGPVFLLSSMVLFWFLGKRIFGDKPALLAAVVLGVSLLVPNLAKLAILDAWLLFFHTGALIGLLLYLKQPKWQWLLLFTGAFVISIAMQPIGSLLTFLMLGVGLYLYHPKGSGLLKLSAGVVVITIILGYLFFNQKNWGTDHFFIAYFQGPFYKNGLYQLAGFLPFTGFVLSGLWESFQKIRKKEEFSTILLIWLVAGLLGQSLLFSLALALLVAKQLEAYFIPQYPYRTIVQTGAILHAIGAFLGITFLLMGGFYQFKGVGFRSGLAFGALYWMPAFIALIGLYGMNRRFVIGGTITGAALATLFFWLQLYPLIMTRMDWPKKMLEEIQTSAEVPDTIWFYKEKKKPFPALGVYAKEASIEMKLIEGTADLQDAIAKPEIRPLIVPQEKINNDSTLQPYLEVGGWNSSGLTPQKYLVLLKSSDK